MINISGDLSFFSVKYTAATVEQDRMEHNKCGISTSNVVIMLGSELGGNGFVRWLEHRHFTKVLSSIQEEFHQLEDLDLRNEEIIISVKRVISH